MKQQELSFFELRKVKFFKYIFSMDYSLLDTSSLAVKFVNVDKAFENFGLQKQVRA